MNNGIIERMQAEINELKSQVAELNAIHGIKAEDSRGELIAQASRLLGKAIEESSARIADNMRNTITAKLTPLTPQDIRDSTVEQAKRDVAELKTHDGLYTVGSFACFAEFNVNKEKRIVVALLRGKNTEKVRARGIAKCAPSDCFNAHIGRAIALRRALGLEVPAEYLTAPQPTEVRVGDVVWRVGRTTYTSGKRTIKSVTNRGGTNYYTSVERQFATCDEDISHIIDDSREDAE